MIFGNTGMMNVLMNKLKHLGNTTPHHRYEQHLNGVVLVAFGDIGTVCGILMKNLTNIRTRLLRTKPGGEVIDDVWRCWNFSWEDDIKFHKFRYNTFNKN